MVTTRLRATLPATPRSHAAAQVAELGTILGVWAHPDDEAYLSSGIMRLALENGQRVVCVTATAGELGTNDPFTWPPEVLGPARRMELQASFSALAMDLDHTIEHHWLRHRDGQCAHIKPEIGAEEIGKLIDRVEPDTVLTFDSGGLTGHPDHQAVSEWTSIALSRRTGITHLEATIARSWLEHFDEAADISSYFDEGYPQVVEDKDIDLNLVLDDGLWAVKDRALRAHASQVDGVIEHLGPELWHAFSVAESFATHRPSAQNTSGKEHLA